MMALNGATRVQNHGLDEGREISMSQQERTAPYCFKSWTSCPCGRFAMTRIDTYNYNPSGREFDVRLQTVESETGYLQRPK